jgi:SAM-dependent methyltransferase
VSLVGALVRRTVPPATLVRWLCRLDNAVYRALSLASIDYGGGLHAKHRLTRYHEFFVARVDAGDRVLDIGCGNGALASDVARERKAVVTGIDQSGASIRAARAAHGGESITFIEGDARRLPAGAFDVVILSNVLEHLDDRVAFLRDTVARTGARRVLVRVPLFERDWRVPLKRELGVEHRLDPTHRIEYTQEEFDAEMTAAGFTVEERQVRWGEIWAVCRPRR